MKVVILAGGLGTRISEETHLMPKPMVEVGGYPILWHIMRIYSHHGFNEFVVCLGYKSAAVKDYFLNFYNRQSDITVDLASNRVTVERKNEVPWKVTLVETGTSTQTGGRVKRVRQYLRDETFLLTYGDGVSDVPIKDVVRFHQQHHKLATVTAVLPGGRFGALTIAGDDQVSAFEEKPRGDGGWVNGGFFVLEPRVMDYIEGDSTMWEDVPLRRLSQDRQLMAFKHPGFWKPMDTLSDKRFLESLWASGKAPWKVWPENDV
ncbi:MAG: glucose-1-phosphate cytidylyltransferase [Patescibacteria group bacterium]|nr:glucose-1-phosphate cytidylyltransferase [Patescibacteria group bacterium]